MPFGSGSPAPHGMTGLRLGIMSQGPVVQGEAAPGGLVVSGPGRRGPHFCRCVALYPPPQEAGETGPKDRLGACAQEQCFFCQIVRSLSSFFLFFYPI